MALISDKVDVSNNGMFSKAGRYTSEKYMIFSKKDEIIHDKRKTISIKDLNAKQKKNKKQDDSDEFMIDNIQMQEQP